MDVQRLIYNYYLWSSDGEAGSGQSEYVVGRSGVKRITETPEAPYYSYLIEFEKGDPIRVFNPNKVFYSGKPNPLRNFVIPKNQGHDV